MSSPVILITGASRSIGAATAPIAARRGYSVVINYLSRIGGAKEYIDYAAAKGAVTVMSVGLAR